MSQKKNRLNKSPRKRGRARSAAIEEAQKLRPKRSRSMNPTEMHEVAVNRYLAGTRIALFMQYEWFVCPLCNEKVKSANFRKHLMRKIARSPGKTLSAMGFGSGSGFDYHGTQGNTGGM